jgi:hypothetical protein
MLTTSYTLAKILREKGHERLADEQELVLLEKVRELIYMLDGDHVSVLEFIDMIERLKLGKPVEEGH